MNAGQSTLFAMSNAVAPSVFDTAIAQSKSIASALPQKRLEPKYHGKMFCAVRGTG
jgi:hypothetical protein